MQKELNIKGWKKSRCGVCTYVCIFILGNKQNSNCVLLFKCGLQLVEFQHLRRGHTISPIKISAMCLTQDMSGVPIMYQQIYCLVFVIIFAIVFAIVVIIFRRPGSWLGLFSGFASCLVSQLDLHSASKFVDHLDFQ